jgi:molybdopterin biosynthesis enzyme MoaB
VIGIERDEFLLEYVWSGKEMHTVTLDQLGLTASVLAEIRSEVFPHLWDCATSRASAVATERHDVIPVEQTYALCYSGCIEEAVGKYSDLLAQVVAGTGKKLTNATKGVIANEAMTYAAQLADWDQSGGWLSMAMGGSPADKDRIPPEIRDSFVRRLNGFAETCRAQAENKITLRVQLSPIHHRSTPRQDPTKATIARIKRDNPRITQAKICSKLDTNSVPVPKRWAARGQTTWSHALRDLKLNPRVKRYISGVKQASGKKRDISHPQLPQLPTPSR